MEILHSDNSTIILSEKNKVYTYIYTLDQWILKFYEEDREEGKLEIEALCDNHGAYTKITMRQKKITRILQLCDNHVVSDIIYDGKQKEPLKTPYIAYQADFKNKKIIPLEAYFSIHRTHESANGNVIGAGNLNNERIKSFIEANEKLKNNSEVFTRKRTKE